MSLRASFRAPTLHVQDSVQEQKESAEGEGCAPGDIQRRGWGVALRTEDVVRIVETVSAGERHRNTHYTAVDAGKATRLEYLNRVGGRG